MPGTVVIQFAFPSFREPTSLRDLLDVAGALTRGIGVVERQPGIIGKQKGKENDKQQKDLKLPVSFLTNLRVAFFRDTSR